MSINLSFLYTQLPLQLTFIMSIPMFVYQQFKSLGYQVRRGRMKQRRKGSRMSDQNIASELCQLSGKLGLLARLMNLLEK